MSPVVNHVAAMRSGQELETSVFGRGIVERDPDRDLMRAFPVRPVLMPWAGDMRIFIFVYNLVAQEFDVWGQ